MFNGYVRLEATPIQDARRSAGLSSWAHAYDIQRLPLRAFQAPGTRVPSDWKSSKEMEVVMGIDGVFQCETQLYMFGAGV